MMRVPSSKAAYSLKSWDKFAIGRNAHHVCKAAELEPGPLKSGTNIHPSHRAKPTLTILGSSSRSFEDNLRRKDDIRRTVSG
jgi:hypothetical protein